MSREYSGACMVGRILCAMGLACALAGILLEGISVEIPGIALGAVGYGIAMRWGDRAGQVLGVATVVLCTASMVFASLGLPGLFLES